ncbi:MAG: TIGR03364 family FAD-dependent oxidoreductase [Bacteroidetes bacterium]|nr:MAG: TIGR03364 family FAD-dependent oxidoreductase [Bacteroidota bacterium]
MGKPSAIVIGAGIVGLATARSLALRGVQVTVFERHEKAVSASIRNFGMVWPVGQPNGQLYQRAMRSRAIWKQVCTEAGLWHSEMGSLHVANSALEAQVMQEVVAVNQGIRPLEWLNAAETLAKSDAVNAEQLHGALYSPHEMIVESRVAIAELPKYLNQKYGVQFYFNTAIAEIDGGAVSNGHSRWQADMVFVCSGADFETLYPQVFSANHFTKCKLQMMRLVVQPGNWRIGPSLCGGLSLIHYKGFEAAPSLSALRSHYHQHLPDYIKWGIHVMVSQNGEGELTIGDSHEYGLGLDPFDKVFINNLIVNYLKTFAQFKDWQVIESWNGTYPKRTNGETEFVHQPQPNVWIVNGLGGAGMTLSFGLAEEVVGGILG